MKSSIFSTVALCLSLSSPAFAGNWLGPDQAVDAADDLSADAESFADAVQFEPEYNTLAYLAEKLVQGGDEITELAQQQLDNDDEEEIIDNSFLAEWKFASVKSNYHELKDKWPSVHYGIGNMQMAAKFDGVVDSFLVLNYTMTAKKVGQAVDKLGVRVGMMMEATADKDLEALDAALDELDDAVAKLSSGIGAGKSLPIVEGRLAKVKTAFNGVKKALLSQSGGPTVISAFNQVKSQFRAVHVALLDEQP